MVETLTSEPSVIANPSAALLAYSCTVQAVTWLGATSIVRGHCRRVHGSRSSRLTAVGYSTTIRVASLERTTLADHTSE